MHGILTYKSNYNFTYKDNISRNGSYINTKKNIKVIENGMILKLCDTIDIRAIMYNEED